MLLSPLLSFGFIMFILSKFSFSKCLAFNFIFPYDQYNSKVFQGVIRTAVVPILPYQTIILFITRPFLDVALTKKNVFVFHCTPIMSWWAPLFMSNRKDLLLHEV
jgi:hypothetical protein